MDEPSNRVFKALADPGRRRLLDALREENGQTLGAMCEHLAMSRQAVSQHLAVLEQASLVAVVWHGREKLHYLNPVPLFEVSDRWIRSFAKRAGCPPHGSAAWIDGGSGRRRRIIKPAS